MRREGARLSLAPSGRSEQPGSQPSSPETHSPERQERLLLILRAEGRPLTVRQMASRAEMPVEEALVTLESLCGAGAIRRLNTVVETYTARFL
jgi:hypothetical protein